MWRFQLLIVIVNNDCVIKFFNTIQLFLMEHLILMRQNRKCACAVAVEIFTIV